MTPTYFQWEALYCYTYKLMSSQMNCQLEHMFFFWEPLGIELIIELFIVCTEQRKILSISRPVCQEKQNTGQKCCLENQGGLRKSAKIYFAGGWGEERGQLFACLIDCLACSFRYLCVGSFWKISSGRKGMVTRVFVWSQFRTWVLAACAAAINSPPPMPPTHPHGDMLRPH